MLGIAITLQRHQQELDAGDAADLLQRLTKTAGKMDRLLNDLLDLDRLAQPTVTPELERVDLGELVERVVKDASTELLQDRPVHVDICPLRLEVDPPKIERIVENLLANAARHTPPGTPVWVRVQPRDHGALLVVEDAGQGCPSRCGRRSSSHSAKGPGPPRTRRAWGSGWRWCACSPSSTAAGPGSRIAARAPAPRSTSTCQTRAPATPPADPQWQRVAVARSVHTGPPARCSIWIR